MIVFFSVSVGEILLVDADQPLYDEFANSEKLPQTYNAMTATGDFCRACCLFWRCGVVIASPDHRKYEDCCVKKFAATVVLWH